MDPNKYSLIPKMHAAEIFHFARELVTVSHCTSNGSGNTGVW
jgi:hypothetical protein